MVRSIYIAFSLSFINEVDYLLKKKKKKFNISTVPGTIWYFSSPTTMGIQTYRAAVKIISHVVAHLSCRPNPVCKGLAHRVVKKALIININKASHMCSIEVDLRK